MKDGEIVLLPGAARHHHHHAADHHPHPDVVIITDIVATGGMTSAEAEEAQVVAAVERGEGEDRHRARSLQTTEAAAGTTRQTARLGLRVMSKAIGVANKSYETGFSVPK